MTPTQFVDAILEAILTRSDNHGVTIPQPHGISQAIPDRSWDLRQQVHCSGGLEAPHPECRSNGGCSVELLKGFQGAGKLTIKNEIGMKHTPMRLLAWRGCVGRETLSSRLLIADSPEPPALTCSSI